MRLLTAALCLALLAAPADAQEVDDYHLMDLTQRFNAGDYSVLPEAQTLADAGVPRAMFVIAVAHLYGQGVPQDHPAGVDWLTRAAEAGFPRAMVTLGRAWHNGWYDLTRDPDNARLWLERAAAL